MKTTRLPKILALLVFVGLSVAGQAYALDYKSIGAAPAVLYDAPSARGKKVFVAPRGMPVEVVLSYGEWSKVRDASGGLSWLESKALVAKRNVVVQAASAKVRATAEDGAALVFAADTVAHEQTILLDPPKTARG